MARHLEAGAIVAEKYKLIERLGGGGMGDVYRAEHMLAGRMVALKILRADFADNEDLTRRFFMEAQAVNKIRHPNIVDVIDAGFSREGPYVVMECLEGTSLAHALTRLGRLDVQTALAVVLPTLSALDAAHRNVIVHRDLKPENIYLAEINGEVRIKLLDFGIAKVTDKDGGVGPRTSTGVVFGTPDYLSPEQANGEGDVDGRSDIFAIGTVLFELITGRRPFEAPTAVATAYKIVHAPAPTLAAMGHEVDPLLQATLDAALAKDRTERFASAADFADALAPLTPHGAIRRQALATLLSAVLARQSTQAAPAYAARPESARAAPAPAPKPEPPKVIGPIAPTLVSSTYTPPGLKPAPLREPIISETPASRAPWPMVDRSPIDRITPIDRLTPIDRITPADRLTPVSMPLSQRPPLSRERAWTPRPLPASSRGRCHVRGTLPRAVCRWIRNVRGADKRDEVLAMLPRELAELAQTDSFNALVWYDLENVDSLVEAATLIALAGDPMAWRALAKENFDRDLGPIFRPTTRTTDPGTLLRRMPSVWSRLFDFGSVRIGETARRVSLRIESFDAASLAFRNVLLGTLEGMLQTTATLTVRVVSGESSFARDFEIEFTW